MTTHTTCDLHDADGRVFIVVAIDGSHLEVLSGPPKWDLASERQICFVANINGGDSLPWNP